MLDLVEYGIHALISFPGDDVLCSQCMPDHDSDIKNRDDFMGSNACLLSFYHKALPKSTDIM